MEQNLKSKWLVTPRPNPNALIKLFCFPYAGGNAATYLPWAKRLQQSVELTAIQPPGRSNRMFEQPLSNMPELIEELIKVIPERIDRPYVFFGHSLGSRVAFELMTQFAKRGITLPIHFIASGSKAPHIPAREQSIYHLSDKEFIRELRELQGTPEVILDNEELMELCLPLLRADFEIAETHIYKEKISFNFTASVFGGTDDVDISESDLLAWGSFFSQPLITQCFHGNHFFIESNIEPVLNSINHILINLIETRQAKATRELMMSD